MIDRSNQQRGTSLRVEEIIKRYLPQMSTVTTIRVRFDMFSSGAKRYLQQMNISTKIPALGLLSTGVVIMALFTIIYVSNKPIDNNTIRRSITTTSSSNLQSSYYNASGNDTFHNNPVYNNIDSITSDNLNSVRAYDFNSIRYISGRYGDNPNFDPLVEQKCTKQMGYYINDVNSQGEIDDPTCTGPIPNILTCCYCYKNVYPSFVHEDRNTAEHIEFLQLNNNNNSQYNDSTAVATSILGQNSYENYHYPDSYYFCMEQRPHAISKEWNREAVLGQSRIIVLTGKWGHQSRYKGAVSNICKKVKKNRWVDYVHCFYDEPDFTMNDKRFERHQRYQYNATDSSARGGGYWFHKAAVMRHYMDLHNDNDFLMWVDIDTMHIFEPIRFMKLMQTMQQRNADIAFELMKYVEKDWTKEDIFTAFDATEAMRESRQPTACFQLVRNSQKMRKYYDAIMECNSDYHMISDEPSILPNGPTFNENRHDQSIFSLFYKKFLSNQTIVGPPMQTTMTLANIHTANLDESINVQCPFKEFYNNPKVIELREGQTN